jgi:hypothetical protein
VSLFKIGSRHQKWVIILWQKTLHPTTITFRFDMQATTSKRFITAMRSSALSRFFSALLHEAGGLVEGVGDVGDLEPILAATEWADGAQLWI